MSRETKKRIEARKIVGSLTKLTEGIYPLEFDQTPKKTSEKPFLLKKHKTQKKGSISSDDNESFILKVQGKRKK